VAQPRGRGWLLIARNQIPTALLGPKVLHRRGTALHHSDQRIRDYLAGLLHRDSALRAAKDHLVLVLPVALKRWFVRPDPVLSPYVEAAGYRVPQVETLREILADFLGVWESADSLFWFSPKGSRSSTAGRRRRAHRRSRFLPPLSTLPDVWISLSAPALDGLLGTPQRRQDSVLTGLDSAVASLSEEFRTNPGGQMDDVSAGVHSFIGFIQTGDIRIVRVSRAKYNARFMGWRVRDPRRVLRYLRHALEALHWV
jgi:hypothetical protein